jgi:uncharacterized UPF0146 family protein
MSGHTPGPWTVSCVRTRESGVPVLQILAADGKVYAHVLYSDRTTELHRASYADANLIAAAPELYEAVLECAKAIHARGVALHLAPMVNAALKKARGEP